MYTPYVFNPALEIKHIVSWIQHYFSDFPADTKAVIGISGGKDSTIAAALLAKAIGPERVMGVLLPDRKDKNKSNPDLEDGIRVVDVLGINGIILDVVSDMKAGLASGLATTKMLHGDPVRTLSENAEINTPPRLRMTALYAVAASLDTNALVVNTCNASEDYVGYSTKYGDNAGDFSPLKDYTVTEILAMGRLLDIPIDLVERTPSDGLCGKSDEERFGFTYDVLDRYIRTGICEDANTLDKITAMHNANLHKLRPMPFCKRLAA